MDVPTIVLDRAGWLSVKRNTNSRRVMSPSRSSTPEDAQRRWPSPSASPSGPWRQFLSSAGPPRAAPPRISVPAEDKNWRQGPLGLAQGEGQRRWDSAGLDDLLDGMPRLEFVLRFTLSHPDLSSTIVGTSSIEHLRANLAVAEKGPLPADLYDEVKKRLG